MVKFILIIFIFVFGMNNLMFGEETKENLISRTVLVLPFYNQDKKNDKFAYLSDVLKDSVSSKLQATDQFNYVDFLDVKNIAKKMGFKIEQLEDEANAIKVAMELKADILVLGKYVVLENKIMMYCRAYDVIENQDVVSSVDGDSGIEIFTLVDELSKDISRKMGEKYPKMNKQTTSDNIFVNNYSGFELGIDYSSVIELIKNSKFSKIEFKKEKIIVLQGYLSNSFKTALSVLAFNNDNKLSNMWFLESRVKQEDKNSRMIFNKNKMVRVFGSQYTKTDEDNLIWSLPKTGFELFNKIVDKSLINFYYHYYLSDSKIEFTDIEQYIGYFKTGFEISAGGGINGFLTEFKVSGYIPKYDFIKTENSNEISNEVLSDRLMTIGFSTVYKAGILADFSVGYYINNRVNVGGVFEISYNPSISAHDSTFLPLYLTHDMSILLAERTKVLTKSSIFKKYIFEVGALLDLEFVTKTHSKYVNGYENTLTTKDDIQKLHGDFFIGGGPAFSVGVEQKIKNFTYEILFFNYTTFGAESFYNNNPEELKINTDPITGITTLSGGFNFNFTIGAKVRFNYNYFKKIK